MARTIRSTHSSAWLIALVTLLGTLTLSTLAEAQARHTPGATGRVRAVDERAAALLEAGNARSATFRQLTEAIEQSDLMVYVESRRTDWPGQTLFMSATPRVRYLRIQVRVMGLDNELLPLLAHELCHAVEIAGAPEVRDRETLRQLYERIGNVLRTDHALSMETTRAVAVQAQVLDELRRGKRPPARRPRMAGGKVRGTSGWLTTELELPDSPKPVDSESYRVYRRAHSERGSTRWHDPASMPPSCVSAQSGWSSSTHTSTRRSGPRFDPSQRSWDAPPRRYADGCDRQSATGQTARSDDARARRV
jgi:hypothetical protein